MVTTTLLVPAVPAGVVAVIEVELTKELAAVVPPIVTDAPLTKPVPVMVILVPPANGPLEGVTEITVGAAVYVNRSAELMTLVPPGVIMVTSTVPLPAGEVTVIWVSEFTVGVTEVMPKLTAVASVKLVPAMVTVVPPASGPPTGEIDATIGDAI